VAVKFIAPIVLKDADPLMMSLGGSVVSALNSLLPWIIGACVVMAIIGLIRMLLAHAAEARREAEVAAEENEERTSNRTKTDPLAELDSEPAQSDLMKQYGPAPACPVCGDPMNLRTAKQGEFAGKTFWGCQRFPTCQGRKAIA
jgi:hypothetical protein